MVMKNKIVIAGGTGFIGEALVDHYKNKNWEVVVLTRGATKTKEGILYQNWDGKTLGDWPDSLNNAEVLINLSGKNINCRFTEWNKKLLLSSRLDATNILSEAILNVKHPPKIWLNASSGAMYQPTNIPNTEKEKEHRGGFLAEMALAWEKAFFERELPKTKRASLRISLIFGNNGGVFPILKKITSLFLGGTVGSGKQKMSWIHIKDAIRAIDYIIDNSIEGPVNFSTKSPPSNKEFMKMLRKSTGVFMGAPAPAFGLKIAGFFLRTEPSLLLNSINLMPQKLIEEGFVFEYGTLEKAFQQLLKK